MTVQTFDIGQVDVPAMALGAMYFGTHVPTASAHACLDYAFETGARFWDTANNYAFWAGGTGDESEETIGSWLAARGSAARDHVVLATKVGARPRTAGAGLEDTLGLSRRAVRDQVDASLTRLRTDHLDVLYAHVDDRDTAFEETLGVFGELRDEGKIRAVAASNLTAPRLEAAMQCTTATAYQALQQRFTYLAPRTDADLGAHVLLDEEVSRVCREYGLTQLGYSPLLSGAYTRGDRTLPDGYEPSDAALSALREIADAHGLDAGQAVLAWMVCRADPVLPVVGVSRPEHVASAWDAVGADLSADEIERLEEGRRG